ncbi:unnamed protein product [Paramecium primaurelia]|uniref:Uncharacterized protein n=3 Tax=Paramecium TaxID=5884 RepID=A0A8S1WCI1_PAROT|nr:unnamed protein product [Paramecium primaurelia]CAD8182221.1 unnamed protein product [Paramecium pentaurelia]CAD8186235.1 unnamed protein product [Paramecium octaurelia]
MQAALAEAIKEEQFMLCFKESKEQAHFQLCMDLFERSKAISQRAFVRYVRSRKQ